jgi:signal transduction histidine kinase
MLRGALSQVDRLEATIDDLLALRRDIEVERAPLRLDAVLADLGTRWHGELAAKGRPLRVISDSDVPEVAITAPAVRQILDVLVANALEHGSGAVTVHGRSGGGGAVIDVADEGVGIVGDRERVFARRSNPESGRGIGLSLARSLAEAEGARLVLRNAGAHPTFSIVLPTTV